MSEFEKASIEAIEDCNGAVKNCAKNSIRHLRKAHKIKEIDKEMGVFRAITTEEEAAASLFFCLKNRQYKNASRLSFKSHIHKQALYPFIQSVSIFLERVGKIEKFPFEEYRLSHTEIESRSAIKLGIKPLNFDGYFEPIPPLHFTMFDSKNGPVTFEKEFQKIVEGNAFKSVKKYIKDIANKRNLLLYADNSRLPKVKGDIDEYLKKQKRKVLIILNLVLMIDPWRDEELSLFVQQALDSFLIILDTLDHSEMTIQTTVTKNA
ncbi:MAG: hypothetical protein ACQETL_19240 [Bacteroidota bacterium]